jgi:hypothetical protein
MPDDNEAAKDKGVKKERKPAPTPAGRNRKKEKPRRGLTLKQAADLILPGEPSERF